MKTNDFLAFVGGAIAGATIAILFAPDKGSETRRKIKESAQNQYDKLRDKAEEMKYMAEDKYNELRGKAGDKYGKMKDKFDKFVEEVEQEINED